MGSFSLLGLLTFVSFLTGLGLYLVELKFEGKHNPWFLLVALLGLLAFIMVVIIS